MNAMLVFSGGSGGKSVYECCNNLRSYKRFVLILPYKCRLPALNYGSACQKVGVPYKNECHKNAILIH